MRHPIALKLEKDEVVISIIFGCLFSFSAFGALDLVVRDGLVYDGTGQDPRQLDVGINKGQIVSIAPNLPRGIVTLDANGMVVAPGFIDVHTHAENIVHHPKAENFLRMGVTTLVLGNCGSSKLELGKFFDQLQQKGIRDCGRLARGGDGTSWFLVARLGQMARTYVRQKGPCPQDWCWYAKIIGARPWILC